MSKLTRTPKEYYEKYKDVSTQIDGAVACAEAKNANKISETILLLSESLFNINMTGDKAIESLVSVANNIGKSLKMYANAAGSYGNEVEPLYLNVKEQLEEIKKQEEEYKKLCDDGPDIENSNYKESYVTYNEEGKAIQNKRTLYSKYNNDKDEWNTTLDSHENKLSNMCSNLDSIISQIRSAGDADVEEISLSGFGLTKPNIEKFEDLNKISSYENVETFEDLNKISSYENVEKFEDLNKISSSENIELRTYKYETSVGPTTVYYSIIPAAMQPSLAIATNSKGSIARKLPWKLADEVGAKFAINFSLFGSGRNEPGKRDGGEGISYDGKNLFIGKHYNCDTTLYMDEDGHLGYIDNTLFKTTEDVAPTLKEKNVKWAAKGFYPIIDEYEYVNNNPDKNIGSDSIRHPRTFFGQLDNGDYIMGVCSGRNTNDEGEYEHGMTLKEVGDFVQNYATNDDGNKIRVRFLMNGDGGGSSAFVADGEKKNVSGEDRATTDIIYVKGVQV